MKFCDLWKVCEQCITGYDKCPPSACITEDQHISTTIKPMLTQGKIGAEEAIFVEEVCKGFFRYRGILEATLLGYCRAMKRNKQDGLAMQIIAYLLFYRFEELGPQAFQAIINKSTSNNRIAELLECLLDETIRREHFVTAWQTVFDDLYIERVMIKGTLEKIRPALEQIAHHFRHKASGTGAESGHGSSTASRSQLGGTRGSTAEAKRSTSGSVAPKPPNSTRARSQHGRESTSLHPHFAAEVDDGEDEAEYVDSPTKHHRHDGDGEDEEGIAPVSSSPKFKLFGFQNPEEEQRRAQRRAKSMNLPPHEIRELENLRPPEKFPKIVDTCTEAEKACIRAVARGDKATSTLDPSVKQRNREKERSIPFAAFHATERPSQLSRLQEEQRQRDAEQFKPLFPNRPSKAEVRAQLAHIKDQTDVRMTAAAIRREDMLYRRKVEEEEKARLRKLQEMRDDGEYQKWRENEERRENTERQIRILQRKEEMMECDENAKEAIRKQQKKNLAISRQFRSAMSKWRDQATVEADLKVAANRQNAEQLRYELKERVSEAVESVTKQKLQIAKEVKSEKLKQEQAVAVQMELEKQRKQAVIEEIKRCHQDFVQRHRTQREKLQSVGHVELGQLVTMTIDELREKLRSVKQEQDEWTAKQHEVIQKQKADRRKEEENMRQNIEANRRQCRAMKDQARAEKDRQEEELRERNRLVEEKRLAEIQQRLAAKREAKKAEQEDRKKEERDRRLAAQLLSADAGAIERHKWKEMERGAENRAIDEQNRRLRERQAKRKLDRGQNDLRSHNLEERERVVAESIQAKDSLFQMKRDKYVSDAALDDSVRLEATRAMKQEAQLLKSLASLR